MTDATYKIINREEKSGSEIELEVEVPTETLDIFKEDSIRELSKDVEIDGFRKGTAPAKLVLEKVGDMAVLEKSAYKAVNHLVSTIISEEKLEALTMPGINVTKIAQGSPLVFKMLVTLLPKIELPDYKEIAKKTEAVAEQKVEEKEIDEYVKYIQTQKAQAEAMAKNEKIDQEKLELPEFNDEFVKTLGDFKTVDEFKKELEKNMLADKKNKAQESRRIKIIEKIINDTKADVPDILVDQEIERMMGKFKHDIEQVKMNVEDYLKQIGKTEEDLKKEWKPDAVKRSKMNLILPKIAADEKLKADEKEVEKELTQIREHDDTINESQARMYVQSVLTNEAVFKFLEEQK